MPTIMHNPAASRPHVALTLQSPDITFATHIADGETQIAWEVTDAPHSLELTVPANVAVCLCACFVAVPTGLISVSFGMKTFMAICRGNANLVKT